ncbi:hypothetical protein EMIT0111MI5_330004 [Burkholderia sp. IT-111MI5]
MMGINFCVAITRFAACESQMTLT